MSTHRRRPAPSIHLGCLLGCLLAAFALVAAACGGDTGDTGAGHTDGSPVEHRSADPDNCPLDALDRAEGRVEIAVWHGLVGLPATTLEELAEEYNAAQDRVHVSVEAQGDYEELFAKFTAAWRASEAQTLPDVLMAQDTDTRFLVDSGSVVAADDCIAADPDAARHYETLADHVRATYTVDGLLWPAAYGVAAPVLYYNRAHLTAAGLDPDDPPGDLQELRAVAEAVKAVRPEGRPLAFRAHSWWIENLARARVTRWSTTTTAAPAPRVAADCSTARSSRSWSGWSTWSRTSS